jgi:hypothetical protein
MLDDYKKLCKDNADLFLSGWERLSKNELCNLYIKNESNKDLAGAYFSALLYQYWPLIPKYHSMSYNVASPEEVYSWLVDSIAYALAHRRWYDEDSNIYKDSTGPDKAINRRMKCARLTYYQFINRKKRKQDFDLLSLDQLQEDYNDTLDLEDSILDSESPSLDIEDFIKNAFNQKDYFLAFLLDIFITEDIFKPGPSKEYFNYRQVIKALKNLDDSYCQRFANSYGLESEQVIGTLKYFKKNSTSYLRQKIDYYIMSLMHNNKFREVLNAN